MLVPNLIVINYPKPTPRTNALTGSGAGQIHSRGEPETITR
jgi:hypothetical protein